MESTMDSALQHAQALAAYLNKCSSTYIIHIALKELGIASDNEGFQLAKAVVQMLYNDPHLTLTNGVYAAVGMPQYDEDQVEGAIRRAVRKAWEDRDERIWRCYFPAGRQGRTKCPSNKAFMMAVVDFVILWQCFCEEVNYAK